MHRRCIPPRDVGSDEPHIVGSRKFQYGLVVGGIVVPEPYLPFEIVLADETGKILVNQHLIVGLKHLHTHDQGPLIRCQRFRELQLKPVRHRVVVQFTEHDYRIREGSICQSTIWYLIAVLLVNKICRLVSRGRQREHQYQYDQRA